MRVYGKHVLVLASMTLLVGQGTAGSAKILGLGFGGNEKSPTAAQKDLKPAEKHQAKPKADDKLKAEAKPKAKPADKPADKPGNEPIVSERLKLAANNLLAARKQVAVARAQLKAAEAEYQVAKFELGAIALRKQALGMAQTPTGKTENLAQEKPATHERIVAPSANDLDDLLPAPVKPTMAPAPGWNNKATDEVSIDDLDLP